MCVNHNWQPGFDLPRQSWSPLNHFRTGQGPCRAILHKWGLAKSPICDCRQLQTMNHIVDPCQLTEFDVWTRVHWQSSMCGTVAIDRVRCVDLCPLTEFDVWTRGHWQSSMCGPVAIDRVRCVDPCTLTELDVWTRVHWQSLMCGPVATDRVRCVDPWPLTEFDVWTRGHWQSSMCGPVYIDRVRCVDPWPLTEFDVWTRVHWQSLMADYNYFIKLRWCSQVAGFYRNYSIRETNEMCFNWLLSFMNIVMPSRSVFVVGWAPN